MRDTAQTRGFAVKGLGEVAIRCKDIDLMTAFYRDVIGLPIMSDFRAQSGIVFFNIGAPGQGVGGHSTILALFAYDGQMRDVHKQAMDPPQTGPGSSLHHLALTVSPEEQEAVTAWYDAQKQPYKVEHFEWIGWRGVFTEDPEGNTVELVAHHKDWKQS
ncbi:MAG: VOC family protein [Pseudomonadota bacterium]